MKWNLQLTVIPHFSRDAQLHNKLSVFCRFWFIKPSLSLDFIANLMYNLLMAICIFSLSFVLQLYIDRSTEVGKIIVTLIFTITIYLTKLTVTSFIHLPNVATIYSDLKSIICIKGQGWKFFWEYFLSPGWSQTWPIERLLIERSSVTLNQCLGSSLKVKFFLCEIFVCSIFSLSLT